MFTEEHQEKKIVELIQQQLLLFQRETRGIKAPDSSEISLGPQRFNRDSDTNGPGSVATATFFYGASTAVMHKTLSEQWFYADGPDFYMWLCPENTPINEGKIYKVSPRSKIEIPPRTKFQLYNPSFKPVSVLMVTNPYWPQDERAEAEMAFPQGPWQRQDFIEFQADVVDEEYMDRIYEEDPIAHQSISGFDYIAKAMASIGENIDTYSIVGDSWFVFDGDTTYRTMNIPDNATTTPSLDVDGLEQLNQIVANFELSLAEQKQSGIDAFNTGMQYYKQRMYSKAENYFARARSLGNPDGAYYEGVLNECGEGCEASAKRALACYKRAANLGHYGAVQHTEKLLYDCDSSEELLLRMTSSKQDYLNKVEEYTASLKSQGKKLFKSKDFGLALYAYEIAATINPKDATLAFNRGLCHKNLGNNDKALQSFQEALSKDPGYIKAQYQVNLLINGQAKYAGCLINQWQQNASTAAISSEISQTLENNKPAI